MKFHVSPVRKPDVHIDFSRDAAALVDQGRTAKESEQSALRDVGLLGLDVTYLEAEYIESAPAPL